MSGRFLCTYTHRNWLLYSLCWSYVWLYKIYLRRDCAGRIFNCIEFPPKGNDCGVSIFYAGLLNFANCDRTPPHFEIKFTSIKRSSSIRTSLSLAYALRHVSCIHHRQDVSWPKVRVPLVLWLHKHITSVGLHHILKVYALQRRTKP